MGNNVRFAPRASCASRRSCGCSGSTPSRSSRPSVEHRPGAQADDRPFGGQPLRDTALLDWAAGLLDAVLGDSVARGRDGRRVMPVAPRPDPLRGSLARGCPPSRPPRTSPRGPPVTRPLAVPAPSRRRLAAVGLLAAVALTGCGDGPVRAGAAATIGESRITTEELARLVDAGLSDPTAAEQLGARPAGLPARRAGPRDQRRARRGGGAPGGRHRDRRRGRPAVPGDRAVRSAASSSCARRPPRPACRWSRSASSPAAGRSRPGPRRVADPRRPGAAGAARAGLRSRASTSTTRCAPRRSCCPTLRGGPRAAGRGPRPVRRGVRARSPASARPTRPRASRAATSGSRRAAPSRQGGLEQYGEQAFAAEVGDTFAVESERGGHVVRVLERRTQTPQQVEPELRRAVLAEQQRRRGAGARAAHRRRRSASASTRASAGGTAPPSRSSPPTTPG